MRGFAKGRLGEGAFGFGAAPRKVVIFEKAGIAERIQQIGFDIAGLKVAGDPHQMSSQIQGVVFAVEEFQAFDERWRDDQRCVREMERIANHQTRLVFERRRREVESHSQAWQHGGPWARAPPAYNAGQGRAD